MKDVRKLYSNIVNGEVEREPLDKLDLKEIISIKARIAGNILQIDLTGECGNIADGIHVIRGGNGNGWQLWREHFSIHDRVGWNWLGETDDYAWSDWVNDILHVYDEILIGGILLHLYCQGLRGRVYYTVIVTDDARIAEARQISNSLKLVAQLGEGRKIFIEGERD